MPEGARWRDSLMALAGVYVRVSEGKYRFDGQRPGSDWYAHGWFSKSIVVLFAGKPRGILLLKRRWRRIGTNRTCHSRPPDDPRLVRYCTLIIVLRIWAWLNSRVGFDHRQEVSPELSEGCGSDRAVQRWTARAYGKALEIQQAIRRRSEGRRATGPT